MTTTTTNMEHTLSLEKGAAENLEEGEFQPESDVREFDPAFVKRTLRKVSKRLEVPV